jgi:hypothetical protein
MLPRDAMELAGLEKCQIITPLLLEEKSCLLLQKTSYAVGFCSDALSHARQSLGPAARVTSVDASASTAEKLAPLLIEERPHLP